MTPPERLFFFDVKDGWEPLCKILDCPVPDELFPHENDRIEVHKEVKKMIKAAVLGWMQIFAASGAVLAVAWYYWK